MAMLGTGSLLGLQRINYYTKYKKPTCKGIEGSTEVNVVSKYAFCSW